MRKLRDQNLMKIKKSFGKDLLVFLNQSPLTIFIRASIVAFIVSVKKSCKTSPKNILRLTTAQCMLYSLRIVKVPCFIIQPTCGSTHRF